MILIIFMQIAFTECIPVDTVNKKLRANQKLLSELLYENEILRKKYYVSKNHLEKIKTERER